MLVLFTGDDVVRAKAEATKCAKGREVVRLGEGGEPLENLPAYLEQQGMFTPAVAVIADRPMENAEQKEKMLELAEACKESSALVILIQPELDSPTKKKFEKFGDVEEYALKKEAEQVGPNSFALVDALQAGDRKRAWILYRQLIESGASAEEIHGTLAWAARGVVLASKTKSAAEAGMKPFPYDKAKRVARALAPGVAEAQSAELVRLYHDARLGRGTLEDLLEMYLLRK
jgi:DNA polymerase III delta subunit